MHQTLTPRQFAQALGVSESSMKRWVDEGRVAAARTAGGHRRIPIAEALRFVRESTMRLVAPEVLGLPDLSAVTLSQHEGLGQATDRLREALLQGDARRAHGLVLNLYLGGETMAAIVDGPIRRSMEDIGERWNHSEEGLVIEHRATDIVNQALNQIRSLFPAPAGAMVAVGGTLAGDPYLLASLAAATALCTEGIDAVHLGPDTPGSNLPIAARYHGARLVWLSVNVPLASSREMADQLVQCVTALQELDVAVMIGGKGLDGFRLPAELRSTPRGSSIAELVGFAKALAMTNGNGPTS